jgi:hypothetical protein
MKGPYERLKYDLRRVWECPICHHRERTPGNTVTCLCRCQQKEGPTTRTYMRLVEDGARRKIPNPAAKTPEPKSEPKNELTQEPDA